MMTFVNHSWSFSLFLSEKLRKVPYYFINILNLETKNSKILRNFFFSKFCLFIYYLLIVDLSRCLIELLLSVILSRAKRRKWKMNFYFLKKSSFPAKVSRKVEICFFSAGHQILRKSRDRPFFAQNLESSCFLFVALSWLFIYLFFDKNVSDGKTIQLTPLVQQHQQKLLKDAEGDLTRQNLFG